MVIKVKEIVEGCMPKLTENGDWIDLYAAEDASIPPYQSQDTGVGLGAQNGTQKPLVFVRLGVAVQLPRGYEAILAPRSSSFKNFGVLQANSIGVVDNSYCGDGDEWRMPVTAGPAGMSVKKGDRICQFRAQLSQRANVWQKLKWLFGGAPKLRKVVSLGNSDRGGFGSTGR